jgi:CheY-like chemotaxis protein/anti-sigma regulatory factor (Ser/Thr protein kinase)
VLDISRLDTGAMKPRFSTVPLNGLLQKIETDFAPMAREKNLKLVVMPTKFSVRSDPTLLRRLIQNLVSNAIKYTPAGRIVVGARRQGDKVVIQVTDSGIGIPSSKFRTVFKEFARLEEGMRNASGLGLGLSIVDRIARVLHHPVELASKPGKGTTFKVVMPMDVAKSASDGVVKLAPEGRATPSLQGFRVLCIDNEPKILEGMQLLISGWGCEVSCAGSIAEMDELMEKSPIPDLVIADYHLGDGSGIGAILRLRALTKADMPALLITADRSAEVRAEAERHAITLQHKPVRPAALRAFMTQVSSQRRAAAE